MSLLLEPLKSPDALHRWVRLFLGLNVPRRAVCDTHQAPFDYLQTAYFEPTRDQLVIAPRGGGKTRLAAVATLLDLLHKPPAQVRVLGGSLEQSLKLWEHLLPDLQRLAGELWSDRSFRGRQIRLETGSGAAVLTQSQRAVRGLRVQKLRCDELELFDPQVWEAAQLVTRSIKGRAGPIAGVVEAISTHHLPGGLMSQCLDAANRPDATTKLTRWCILDVLERCPPERDCDACPLWDECRGLARTRCDGYVRIDDAIRMKQRVSRATWEAEMLCRRPVHHRAVFPDFDPRLHVTRTEPDGPIELSGGVDFGFANPFVCLWVMRSGGKVRVIDEYVQTSRPIEEHIEQINARGHGRLAWVGADPAGNARSDQTCASSVQRLRSAGLVVRTRASRILDGIERIRAMLRPAIGQSLLSIHPRCRRLIEAMSLYRYGELGNELPLKDGRHDHLIDALRYNLINAFPRELKPRDY